MVKSSKGLRAQTRHIFSKKPRDRGLSPITRSLQVFEKGEKASIKIDPSIHKGQPHKRYYGLTGTVMGMQGKAILVKIRDGNAHKTLIVAPEHLRKQAL